MTQKNKCKRIMLVRLPTHIEQTHIVEYDRSTMSDLQAMYIGIEKNQPTLHFHITFSETKPLYFVRSSNYPDYYYPVRDNRCRCLEWQECGYCRHVDDLSAITTVVA